MGDGIGIDLVSQRTFSERGHPWEQYAWLRANDPVHWHDEADGPGFWAITKYDDIRTVSRQPASSANAAVIATHHASGSRGWTGAAVSGDKEEARASAMVPALRQRPG